MTIRAPIRGWWMRLMRLRRAWRTRLRRPGALIGLLLVCAIGLGGPLICVLHCEIWLPLALRSASAQQHHHHHHMSAAGDLPPAGASETIQPSQPFPVCSAQDGSGPVPGSPLPLPPSPVHEMIAALDVLLAITLLILLVLRVSPRAPPCVRFPPPLRPPIPFAG